VVGTEPPPEERFLAVFFLDLIGVVLWRLCEDFLCFGWFDDRWCLVLPFDGGLEPGLGDELDGCLCGAPGPVVVVVVGVVPVWVVPVPVVEVELVVGVVVDVVVVVVVVAVDPGVVVEVELEVEELVEDDVVVDELLELVVEEEQPASTWVTAPGSTSGCVGWSAASSAPVVGTETFRGIQNGTPTPLMTAVTHCRAGLPLAGTVPVVLAEATGIAHRPTTTSAVINIASACARKRAVIISVG
jgi:hypothetical protein